MPEDRVLRGDLAHLVARVLLCSAFIASGVIKLLDIPGATAEVRGLTGLEPANVFAWLVIATQLGGSALVVAGGRWLWVGAVMLAGFTFVATILGHPFWSKTGVPQVRDLTTFLEHMGLIGGFVLAVLLSRGRAGGSRD